MSIRRWACRGSWGSHLAGVIAVDQSAAGKPTQHPHAHLLGDGGEGLRCEFSGGAKARGLRDINAFPAEHWVHPRTTNPIESTTATVRHRTSRTKNCISRSTCLGLAFRLAAEAAKSWRRIRAPEKVAKLLAGTRYEDGVPLPDDAPEQQREAA